MTGPPARPPGPDDVPTGELPVVPDRPPQPRTGRRRAQVLAAGLLALLGFSLVIQARQTSAGLTSLRQSELIQVLDDLGRQNERLEEEARALELQEAELRSGTDRARAAERSAAQRLEVLGILAGTVPAIGPGIELDITDPGRAVSAAQLLNCVQELRDAGAEAMQVNGVRIVADTAFVDGPDGVLVGDVALTPPYRFVVIGDGATLASALDIPGGVLETLRQSEAEGVVTPRDTLTVTALRQVRAPQYARPAPAGSP